MTNSVCVLISIVAKLGHIFNIFHLIFMLMHIFRIDFKLLTTRKIYIWCVIRSVSFSKAFMENVINSLVGRFPPPHSIAKFNYWIGSMNSKHSRVVLKLFLKWKVCNNNNYYNQALSRTSRTWQPITRQRTMWHLRHPMILKLKLMLTICLGW